MKHVAKRVAGLGLAAAVGYPLVGRPWLLHWGATRHEVAAVLPGDEIVARPRTRSTRAVSIDGHAEDVWPWLAQLGQGRGGLYSYDWLENLFGADIHSADRVVPELQNVVPGDRVRLFPATDTVDLALEVARVEPNHALVLKAPGTPQEAFAAGLGYPSWAFVIRPARAGVRLIARWRCDFPPTMRGFLAWKYGIEPVHFLMERAMLRGIKRRAEAMGAARGVETALARASAAGTET